MKFNYFFRITWLVQLLVGISLFSVSFLIESKVLQAFINTPILAMSLAGALELGKAGAIIWHRYMLHQATMGYPKIMRLTSTIFRLGLVLLSMLCSLLFLSDNLDRPNLETVRSIEMKRDQTHFQEELERLEDDKTNSLQSLSNKQSVEFKTVKADFDRRIKRLEADLKKEMNNVINGTFKGPRYAEFSTLLEKEKQQSSKTLNKLAQQQKQAFNKEYIRLSNTYEEKRTHLYEQADARRKALINNDFANDERANDSRIVSFLKVYESVFNSVIIPLQFVFVFSLLLSLLMEIGIMLAFDIITLSILPEIKAKQTLDLHNDLLETEINQQVQEDAMRHTEAVNRIRNTADNVMHKAREYINANQM
jgi:uncharacterized membrane protein YciS (DUF1049 family)